jgi:CubicO group peptidase (beta-lactamase class C family)
MEDVLKMGEIKRGAIVRNLPVAAVQVDPKITHRGRTSSIDAFMAKERITGLIAVKDGEIVLEKYALGRKPDDRWTSFSVAKSMTATLIGAAVQDRLIRSVFDPITYYIPELKGSAYEGVTLRDVMTMTSGVKWNEDYADPRSDVALSGVEPFDGRINPIVAYMARLPREAEPGRRFVYKTGETDLAGIALSRALGGKSLSQYASEKIWAPYGMEQDAIWMLDRAGLERGGCCMSMTLRDYARIGLFMLGGGEIDGRKVLPEGWVEESTGNRLPRTERERGQSYGYFWWPSDAPNYRASGIFGQGIHVYPEENLVIAINGATRIASGRQVAEVKNALVETVRKAANATDLAAAN